MFVYLCVLASFVIYFFSLINYKTLQQVLDDQKELYPNV